MRSFAWVPFLFACANSASAQDAVTYSYDALGRLVTTTNTSGPNNNIQVTNNYDPAGNRARQRTGPATGANRPPVANADTVGVTCRSSNTVNVVANDTDPDGNAVSLVSISKVSGSGSANVSNATTVTVYGGTSPGQSSLYDYVIQDGNGGSATGRLTVQTVGSPMICA